MSGRNGTVKVDYMNKVIYYNTSISEVFKRVEFVDGSKFTNYVIIKSGVSLHVFLFPEIVQKGENTIVHYKDYFIVGTKGEVAEYLKNYKGENNESDK